jgi:hypothetical protein
MSIIITLFGVVFQILWIFFLVRLVRSKLFGNFFTKDIPPLDLVDARKLTEMVSEQVEEGLKPLLQAKGFSEQELSKVLTRSSLYLTFRR